VGSNPTRAIKDWPAGGRAKEVTEKGPVQSEDLNVQLASTSPPGPTGEEVAVRTRAGRSADGQQLAPEPSDGNGEPIRRSTSPLGA
jgi:hypothetical protein